MADDDIDDIDFDDGNVDPDDVGYDDNPPLQMPSSKARREIEKRLEMRRLRELLDDTDFDGEF